MAGGHGSGRSKRKGLPRFQKRVSERGGPTAHTSSYHLDYIVLNGWFRAHAMLAASENSISRFEAGQWADNLIEDRDFEYLSVLEIINESW